MNSPRWDTVPVFAGALVVLLLGTLTVEAQPVKQESLPAGAVARLGNGKFWHGEMIEKLIFSPDEKQIASCSYGKIRIWDMATGNLERELTWPVTELPVAGARARLGLRIVPEVNFSADGKSIIAADTLAQKFRIWDVTTGKVRQQLPLPVAAAAGAIRRVVNSEPFSLSPDGRHLARVDSAVVKLIDVATKKEIKQIAGHTSSINNLAYSPDGTILATASGDQTVRLWHLATGKATVLRGHRSHVIDVAFSPDGKRILTASADGTFRIWDSQSGKTLLRRFWWPPQLPIPGTRVRSLAISSAVNGLTVQKIWFDAKGERISCMFETSYQSSLYLGTQIIASFDAKTGNALSQRVYPAAARRVATSRLAATAKASGEVLVSRHRPLVARASQSHHIRFFSLTTGEAAPLFSGQLEACRDVSMAGNVIVFSQEQDPNVYVWDWKNGNRVRALVGHTSPPSLTRIGSDGKTLATFSDEATDRTISIWDLAQGEEIRQIPGWDAGPRGGPATRTLPSLRQPVLSPDGRWLALRNRSSQLQIVETRTGKTLPASNYTWDGEGAVAFTADGQRLLVSDSVLGRGAIRPRVQVTTGTTITQIDVATGKMLGKLTKNALEFAATDMALTDEQVLLASKDGTVRRVSRTSGNALGHLGHALVDAEPNPPRRAAARLPNVPPLFRLSPDGKMIALVGKNDSKIELWELASGKLRATLTGHRGVVQGLSFAADGQHLVSGSQDGTLLVWALQSVKSTKKLSDQQLATLWAELASSNADQAYQAMKQFIASGAATVAYFQTHLKHSLPATKETIAKLLGQLDGQRYRTREIAHKKLAELGTAIRPFLEKAHKNTTSAEAKDRLSRLLKQLDTGTLSGDRLREVRAVEVLEGLGDRDAIAVLQQVTKGSESTLAHQARLALSRLQPQSAKP